MNVNIICVGKIKEAYIQKGIDEFSKRLGAYTKLKIIELKETGDDQQRDRAIEKEGKEIISIMLKNKAYNILLDVIGKNFSSKKFASKISELMLNGNSTINFIIGGSYGVSKEVREKSNLRLSFSEFTFPHQMMRLILLEQVYRWFNIINNGKYHK